MIISDFSFLGKTMSSKLGNLRSNYFQFGSVFIKKKIKLNFFFKKQKPGQTDQFWFGSVFWAKTGFSGLARFFRFGSVFFRFRFGLVFCL
jgi:hypothetical protein